MEQAQQDQQLLVLLGQQGRWAAHQDQKATQVQQDEQVLQGQAGQVLQALREQQELVQQDQLGLEAPLDCRVCKDHQAFREQEGLQV